MKRAQPNVILSRLFKLNVAAENFDNVDARKEVLDKALGNHFGKSVRIADAMMRTSSLPFSKKKSKEGQASRCLTNNEAFPMSARPAIRGFSSAIVLPIACGPVAPESAIAASIAAASSASDIC